MLWLTKIGKRIYNSKSKDHLCPYKGYLNINFFSKGVEESPQTNELYSIQADDNLEALLEEKEAEVEKMRNKSRLWTQHYNILHGKVPYNEPKSETHLSLKYKRRMFGRYGYESGVNPGALWPSKDEIMDRCEYEKVAFPYTVHEMLEKAQQCRANEDQIIKERQTKIANNLLKLEQWKQDIANRAAKRMQLAAAAKAKKEALIEEVKRHFGYKVDPRDERFKEMLIQKEKDQKKKLKAEKAQARQEKILASLSKESAS